MPGTPGRWKFDAGLSAFSPKKATEIALLPPCGAHLRLDSWTYGPLFVFRFLLEGQAPSCPLPKPPTYTGNTEVAPPVLTLELNHRCPPCGESRLDPRTPPGGRDQNPPIPPLPNVDFNDNRATRPFKHSRPSMASSFRPPEGCENPSSFLALSPLPPPGRSERRAGRQGGLPMKSAGFAPPAVDHR